jgi:hypothetical protein
MIDPGNLVADEVLAFGHEGEGTIVGFDVHPEAIPVGVAATFPQSHEVHRSIIAARALAQLPWPNTTNTHAVIPNNQGTFFVPHFNLESVGSVFIERIPFSVLAGLITPTPDLLRSPEKCTVKTNLCPFVPSMLQFCS